MSPPMASNTPPISYRYPLDSRTLSDVTVAGVDYYGHLLVVLQTGQVSVSLGHTEGCSPYSASLKGNNNAYFKDDDSITSRCSCPTTAKTCVGNDVIVYEGRWRVVESAYTDQSCPYSRACSEGNRAGNLACSEGYTGPLCSLCAVGYTFSGTAGQCEPCNRNESALRDLFIIIPILCYVLFTVLLVKYVTFVTNPQKDTYGLTKLVKREIRTDLSTRERIRKDLQRVFQGNFKIIISALQ
eukprot:gene5681-11462_t